MVDLFTNYHARVRIQYVEAAMPVLDQRNRSRKDTVPTKAIRDMMDRWELPISIEADRVEYWVDGRQIFLPAESSC